MSDQETNASDSDNSDGPPDNPLCVICDQPAAGVGPFSRHHLCPEHLTVDEADARKLKKQVDGDLRAYSQHVTERTLALEEELQRFAARLREVEEKCDAIVREVSHFRSRVTAEVTARREAVHTCLRDLEDISSYKQEVASAEATGNMAEVCELAMSMQVSLRDLQADFDLAQRLRVESSERESSEREEWDRKVERLIDCVVGGLGSCDAGVTARPVMKNAGVAGRPETREFGVTVVGSVQDSIVKSHEIQLDVLVTWICVCSNTSGFFSDRSGRVVPAESAGNDSVALPKQIILARAWQRNYLAVFSVDGKVKLQFHCHINWNNKIWGLHCDHQLLYIAQQKVVTVTDLSGRLMRNICTDGLGDINGIGGNAASVFVSSCNTIAVFNKATGLKERLITLKQPSGADLGNLAIHENCIVVTDRKHNQVHRVRIDTQQLVASHPTQRSGLPRFEWLMGVAVDRRGRLFVSECNGHSVRAVSVEDGSLLWTQGKPGKSGGGDDRHFVPLGLAVVTGDQCEQLVVADRHNRRLLFFNLL